MTQLTVKPPVLRPKRKRRRAEDTGSFRQMALPMTCGVVVSSALRVTEFLWDTIDWLQQWEMIAETGMDDFSQECTRPDFDTPAFDFAAHL